MLTQYLYSYLIVDYDRSNFSVSQALFPDPSIEQNLVLIYPPGNDNTSLTSPTSSTSDNKSGHHLQIGVIVAIVAISVVVFAISLLGLFWRKLLEIWTIRPIPKDRLQFRVAIICALGIEEFNPVATALDMDFKKDFGKDFGRAPSDTNSYTTGRLANHDVVIVCLPNTGKGSATSASTSLLVSYPNIRLALVVGVCAAAPKDQTGKDIILGDVLISTHVVQTDYGRHFDSRIETYQGPMHNLGRPNKSIRAFLNMCSSKYKTLQLEELVAKVVTELLKKPPLQEIAYPGKERDKLFLPEYQHQHSESSDCKQCGIDPAKCVTARNTSCTDLGCAHTNLIPRQRLEPRSNEEQSERGSGQEPLPHLHFGPIASADQVIRSASLRDELVAKYGVIGFEMEAAGVWDNIPTVVIKGACDYADSHKNKDFQLYASVTAAACTKALLRHWHSVDISFSEDDPSPGEG